MSSSFQQLKNNRETAIAAMRERIESEKKRGDDRFWVPPQNQKDGSGNAIIRFLPAPEGEQFAWVKRYVHMWDLDSSGRRKFRENCPTTVDANGEKHDCPICTANSKIWDEVNAGKKELKPLASKQSRKLTIISNIYVVSDPERPENEGKVFLYRYGDRIWQKIMAKMNPPFQNVKPIDPFDLWEGCDFRLSVRKVENFPNYDLSEFDSQSKLGGFADNKLEAIWKQQHSLLQFIKPEEFKQWDELASAYERVVVYGKEAHGGDPTPSVATQKVVEHTRRVEEKFHGHPANMKAPVEDKSSQNADPLDLSNLDLDADLKKLLGN